MSELTIDSQLDGLIAALDARNIQSAGDLERYDRQSLDMFRLRRGVHEWFCTMKWDGHRLDSPKRPHIGWACERGAAKIADVYAHETER